MSRDVLKREAASRDRTYLLQKASDIIYDKIIITQIIYPSNLSKFLEVFLI